MSAFSRFRLPLLAFAGLAFLAASAQGQVSFESVPLDAGFGPLDSSPPSIPIPQLIKEFEAKETVFRNALNNYTYQRSVKVQTINDDGKVDGQYFEVSDITFDPTGRKVEHVIEAPVSTLERVTMSPADFSDIEHRLPFVLTTEDAEQYNVTYVGKEKVDQVETYVFNVAPKVIEKHHRYFQGRIWVDQKEHQIVVTDGKNVPDDLRKGHEDLSLPFITYRQQIDGKYWFPVYTHEDGVLHFTGGDGYMNQDVHLRETVKYTNYKQYGTTVQILFNGQEVKKEQQPGQQGQPPAQPPK